MPANRDETTTIHALPGIPERDDDVIHVFYLYIEESPSGFRWQVRQHERSDPIEVGPTLFVHDEDAQSAGRLALDRVFARFRGTLHRDSAAQDHPPALHCLDFAKSDH